MECDKEEYFNHKQPSTCLLQHPVELPPAGPVSPAIPPRCFQTVWPVVPSTTGHGLDMRACPSLWPLRCSILDAVYP